MYFLVEGVCVYFNSWFDESFVGVCSCLSLTIISRRILLAVVSLTPVARCVRSSTLLCFIDLFCIFSFSKKFLTFSTMYFDYEVRRTPCPGHIATLLDGAVLAEDWDVDWSWLLESWRPSDFFVYDFLKLLQVTKIVNNYYFCQRISYFLYNFWTLRARFNVAVSEHPALDVVQYWLCHAQLCAHVCLHFQGYQNYRHIKCVCFNCIPIAKITFRGEVKPNR